MICPVCDIELNKLKKKELEVNVCKKCHGMWIDDGNIAKLAELGNKAAEEIDKKRLEKD